MQRYNSFKQIHKGLRVLLFDTAHSLQQTDFTNEQEAGSALNKVREAVMLFDEHARKEDQYILPAIAQYEPSVTDAFEQEHKKDVELSNNLTALAETFFLLDSDAEKQNAGEALNEAFIAFVSFNLEHMAKEEHVLNKLLWRHYTDDHIKQMQQQIVRDTKPWIADFYFKWMLRGISVPEAITWLKTVRATAPGVVFDTLIQKASAEFSHKKFQQLQQGLAETLVIA
jgi:hypothetical protein